MATLVRSFLAAEAVAFGVAVLMHRGVWARGYEHAKAATAESVIALVLLVALATTVASPRLSRTAGLVAQAFALVGTLVGLFTIAIGVGPRTPLDLVLHALFVVALVTGLVLVARGTAGAPA